MRRILNILAPLALAAVAAMPARAAETLVPAYLQGGTWADLSAAAGFSRYVNPYNDFTKSDLLGEARVGFTGFGMPLQFDLSATTNQETDEDANTHMNLAAHFGVWTMPGSSLGIMVSTGAGTYGDRFSTIAGEGVWGLNALGGARLVVQGGWTVGTDDWMATYLHGVLQVALAQNILLSAGVGAAQTNDSETYWRFGAKGELALNSMFGAFLQWDRAQKSEGSYNRTEDRFLFGGTVRVNQGSLASVSPLHDYNLFTGVNSDFKY